MRVIADLHCHSRYARATSSDLTIESLERWARVKGVTLLGTGDFTHPNWFEELKRKLKETESGSGIFSTSSGFPFILQTEVAAIYEHEGRSKKIHNLILAPSFEVVAQINDVLSKRSDLRADGRPVLDDYSCPQLVEEMTAISPDIVIVPAHAWTPWFALFGSNSGFDSIKECFKDQAKHIFAIETGLSSDPAMNWRLSQLDNVALLSNSDLHSYWPWRIGREANVFELPRLSYAALVDAIKTRDPARFICTIEVDPSYGKYHFDGHRNCGVSLDPLESTRLKNKCPQCGRKLTIGVAARIEALADRPVGFVPKNAIPFKSIIPLHEILAKVLRLAQLSSPRIWREYDKLTAAFGNELAVLLEAPRDKIENISGEKIADAVLKNRNGQIKIKPGYDGVYGEPVFDEAAVETEKRTQRNLFSFAEREEPIPA